MATDDQLAVIRQWTGSNVDITDVDARLTRLVTPERVALELLRTQLADMLANPTKLDVDGDVAADWSANLLHLRAQIKSLEGLVASQGGPAGSGAVTVASLSRPGRRR